MKLRIVTRSGKILFDAIEINEISDRVSAIHRAIYRKFPRWYPSRQRLTFGSENKVLDADYTISQYNISDGDTITFKDLGNW
jgi:hypothetical protein